MSGVVNVGGGECRGGECRTITKVSTITMLQKFANLNLVERSEVLEQCSMNI